MIQPFMKKWVAPIKNAQTGKTNWMTVGVFGYSVKNGKGGYWSRINGLPVGQGWDNNLIAVDFEENPNAGKEGKDGEKKPGHGGTDECPF